MVVIVKYSYRAHQPLPGKKWKRLGELKLQAGSNTNGIIKAWLTDILDDLSLSGEYVNRLLASIDEATLRVLSPDAIEEQFDHLEIVVLAPAGPVYKGQTWGF